jgi:hypothetical protein
MRIDWSKQHCGVHRASGDDLFYYMPDLKDMVIETFPERVNDFVWDVKVHMLMPGQYPCIPNWHYDNVPRVNNKQDFDLVDTSKPMYLWLSGAPLTEFRKNGKSWHIKSGEWVKFNQTDEHRGTISNDFCWRGFIRATHKDVLAPNESGSDCLRRHSQVYLDASNFSW